MKKAFQAVILLILLIIPLKNYAFVIDGNLTDWGVTPETDYTPKNGIFSWVEDFVDYNNSGYVGPGYGGQPYDFEALYASYDESKLYIAMIMGMPPTGSGPIYSAGQTPRTSPYFYPGDIALNLNGDNFYEYGLELTGISDNTPDGPAQNGQYSYNPALKGNLYKVLNTKGWNKGLALSGYTETELNYRESGSLEFVCANTVVYIQSYKVDHYVVETAIPLSKLNTVSGATWKIHWTQTCGNDIGEVSFVYTPYLPPDETNLTGGVPEPASFVLLLCGLCGIIYKKLKK